MAEQQDEQSKTNDVSRRDWLKWAWGAAGAAMALEAGALALKFFAPKVAAGEFGGVFEIGNVDEFPPGSVTPFTAGRFYLVRLDDGGFLALYRKCTHLGCAVPWDQASGQFVCPCHASAFEPDGDVINPPAPRPLDRFPVTIDEGGVIRVDTGTTIERDRPSPDDAVYV
jgi:cytochrome b6-f complex iron-sulfur subunit